MLGVGVHLQDGHEDGEPELLRAEQAVRIRPPLAKLDVVAVAQDDKNPGHLRLGQRENYPIRQQLGYIPRGRAILQTDGVFRTRYDSC